MEGAAKPKRQPSEEEGAAKLLTPNQQINRQLMQAKDSDAVLDLVEANYDALNAVNAATALHIIAARNKKKRARRDVLQRDARFLRLVDAMAVHSSDEFEGSARAIADAMWAFATLRFWPATLLTPMLTSVSVQLERDAFEAQHLSSVVWALGRLQCKPVRLLERAEQQAVSRMGSMDLQNVANMLWGFAALRYQPSALLPKLAAALTQPGMLDAAKPVEVADLAFSFEHLSTPGEHQPVLGALAARAAPDEALPDFSSRQLVSLISAVAALEGLAALPEGRLEEWLAAVRAAHQSTPMLVADSIRLEAALRKLGLDASWIKSSEMLNTWTDLAGRAPGRSRSRRYSDDELRAVFTSIDTDGSGDIDQSELEAAIRAINPDADDETVRGMLTFADADGDLQVSFDEFKEILLGGGVAGGA